MLPSEAEGADEANVATQKNRIRDEIIKKTNEQILAHDNGETDPAKKTLPLLRALGSDLNINAFALNWKRNQQELNKETEDANYLMSRVVRSFSVETPGTDPHEIPLYLTSTEFSHEEYGECLTAFKRRLGLDPSGESLMVLRNVVMSPFASLSSNGNFIEHLGKKFKEVVGREVDVSAAIRMLGPKRIMLCSNRVTELPGTQRGYPRLSRILGAWQRLHLSLIPAHVPPRQAATTSDSQCHLR